MSVESWSCSTEPQTPQTSTHEPKATMLGCSKPTRIRHLGTGFSCWTSRLLGLLLRGPRKFNQDSSWNGGSSVIPIHVVKSPMLQALLVEELSILCTEEDILFVWQQSTYVSAVPRISQVIAEHFLQPTPDVVQCSSRF